MRAPVCAAAGLAAAEALLRAGAPPSSLLLVASTYGQARLLEHVVDVALPLGAYEMGITSVWGLGARLLAERDGGGAGGLAAAAAWSPPAAAAWFRRHLKALPLRRFRPANDPARYAGALEAHFETLRYAGVSEADYAALAGATTAAAAGGWDADAARELAAAYAAWLAIKRGAGVVDRSDVLVRAVEALDRAAAAADSAAASNSAGRTPEGSGAALDHQGRPRPLQSQQWRHVVAVDGHNLSPLALRLLVQAFPPTAPSVATLPQLVSAAGDDDAAAAAAAAEGGEPLLPPSVHVCVDPARCVSGPPGWGHTVATALAQIAATPLAPPPLLQPGGFHWSLSLHDEAAASAHPGLLHAARERLLPAPSPPAVSRAAGKRATGSRKASAADTQPEAPPEPQSAPPLFSKADLAYIGADYAQACSTALPSSTAAAVADTAALPGFLDVVGLPPTTDRVVGAARAVAALVARLRQREPRLRSGDGAVTMCVACRSMPQARALQQALRAELEAGATAASGGSDGAPAVRLLCDAPLRLADVEEVRVLLAALGCVAAPGDHRHVYTLATSALYGVPVPAMAALLHRAKQQQQQPPLTLTPTSDAATAGGLIDFGGLRPLLEAEAAPPGSGRAPRRQQQLSARRKGRKGAAVAEDAAEAPADTLATVGDAVGTASRPPWAAALRRLLDDVDDLAVSLGSGSVVTSGAAADATSAAPSSTTAALARFARRSGLAGALVEPSSAQEESAGSALAALLQLCREVESAASASAAGDGGTRQMGGSLLRRGRGARTGGRGAVRSGIYSDSAAGVADGTAAATAVAGDDSSLSSGGLPFLFQALTAAVMDEGAALSGGADASSPAAAAAASLLSTHADNEDAATAAELAPLLAGRAVAAEAYPRRDGDTVAAASGASSASSATADALEAPTTVAVMLALERARQQQQRPSEQQPAAPLPYTDFQDAAGVLSSGGSSASVTVVLTTERRAVGHQYDVLVVPWASDTALPGAYYAPPLPLPAPLFDAARHLPGLLPPAATAAPAAIAGGPESSPSQPLASSRLYLPAPRDSAEHDTWARHRLGLLLTNARLGALFVAPARVLGAPASSQRRSRYLNQLFGPAPATVPKLGAAGSDAAPPSEPAASMQATQSPFTATQTPMASGPLPLPSPATPLSPPSPLSLSFSGLSEFEWCPLRYYYSRVARLPPPRPTPAALLYGRALHEGVSVLGRAVMAAAATATAVDSASAAVTLDDAGPAHPLGIAGAAAAAALLTAPTAAGAAARAAFRRALPGRDAAAAAMDAAYAATWAGHEPRRAGSGSSSGVIAAGSSGGSAGNASDHLAVPPWQADELAAEARAAVRAFYDAETAALTAALDAHDRGGQAPPLSLPAYIEQRFRFPLTDVAASGGIAEDGCGAAGVEINGVIDRVDVVAAPVVAPAAVDAAATAVPSLAVVVREFKTSMQWRSRGHLGRTGGDSKQLSLYAMAVKRLAAGELAAATSTAGSATAVVHSVLTAAADGASPQRVSLESIETREAHPVDVGRKQLVDLAATLATRAAAMRAGPYPAKASPVTCGVCPYGSVCSAAHGRVRTVTPEAARAHRA